MLRKAAFFMVVLTGLLTGPSVFANTAPALMEMSLEELMNVEVTTVSKTPQLFSTIPAAVTVISNEEIRRSGATTIPDILRLVPGVHVARIDANKWAVSIRGFTDRFANKLLVLMDGRVVYDPLYAGTFWDIQDTVFEDIDRIEVIRGPGGTIWGSNAVNGVINIITKSAKETHGGYVSAGGGTKERGFGDFRYGGKAGNADFRVYGKYVNRDDSFEGHDEWNISRAGFRTDWDNQDKNAFTVQGDIYDGQLESTLTQWSRTAPLSTLVDIRDDANGGNLLARFVHTISDKSDLQGQVYYDYTYRNAVHVEIERHTGDFDLQYRFPIFENQEIIVGSGYRVTTDDTTGTAVSSFIPEDRRDDVWSWFVQDEIKLVENLLTLTLGSKFEINDYTGFEYQPSGRLAYYLNDKTTVWGSISRAVRTPTPADVHSVTEFPILSSAGGTTTSIINRGQDEYKSEELISYESGFRTQIQEQVSLDISGFYNEYSDLRTAEQYAPDLSGAPLIIQPVSLENNMAARTYGGELTLNYFATPDWRLIGSYAYLYMSLMPGPTSNEVEGPEKRSPAHTLSAQSLLKLPWNLEFDSSLRYVDELKDLGIKSYTVADLRLGWEPRPGLEISVVARNLFYGKHYEFLQSSYLETFGHPRKTESSVYGKVDYKF